MIETALLAAWAALTGACVGSFTQVVVSRVPHRTSIMGRSACDACGTTIPWFRNLPLVTWPALRGTAACCGSAIPPSTWFTEVATAAGWALFVAPVATSGPGRIVGAVIVAITCTAAVTAARVAVHVRRLEADEHSHDGVATTP